MDGFTDEMGFGCLLWFFIMPHAFHEFNENVQEINLNFVYSWLHISVPIIALPDACLFFKLVF